MKIENNLYTGQHEYYGQVRLEIGEKNCLLWQERENKTQEFPLEKFWRQLLFEIPDPDKTAVCQLAAKYTLSQGSLSEVNETIVRYYAALDLAKIQPFVYEYPLDANYRFVIEADEYGVIRATVLGNNHDYSQRHCTQWPGQVWAYGPQFYSMPKEKRIELRQKLHSFLSPQSGIALEDGFPIIDYDKIPPLNFSQSIPDGVEEAELRGGIVSSYYQQRHDCGSSTTSVEAFLWNPLDFLRNYAPIPQHYDEIAAAIRHGLPQ